MTVAHWTRPEPLAATLLAPNRGVSLFWLGQAGFLIRHDDAVLLIDPYLSDSLADKYRGGPRAYTRMMPAPIEADALPRLDLVLCTHRHSDHMDPGTLPTLARRHPDCRFVVPMAEHAAATALGLPADRVIGAVAGRSLTPLAGVAITPCTAAHEAIERDAHGHDHYLGYGIAIGAARLYHSGDCVPYPGLATQLRAFAPELALLPVNGRDAARAASGIPGNFTLAEAVELCRSARIPAMIAHHWGLFAFNTIDPAAIDAEAARAGLPRVLRPATNRGYRIG